MNTQNNIDYRKGDKKVKKIEGYFQAAEMVHSSQYRKHDALSCHKYKKIFETGEIFAVKKAGTFLKSKKDLHSIALYLHIADPAGNHRQHQRKHDRVHWRKLIKKHHISVQKL